MSQNTIIDNLSVLVGLSSNICLRYLTNYLYKNTDFIGAKYNGKIYKELPNMWAMRDDFTKEDLEKECEGYFECETDFKKISVDLSDPKNIFNEISFLYSYRNDIDQETEDDEDDEDDEGKYNSRFTTEPVIEFLQSLVEKDKETLINGDIKIQNPYGINKDHRGSDHCELVLPFMNKIKLSSPSLREYISALYLLKSHKFDKWYELYIGSLIKKTKSGNRLVVLKFDHGS